MIKLTKEKIFQKETLRVFAKEIIDNSKNLYCNKDGLLIQPFDSQGRILNSTNILEDLGDYLPFFLYFGEIDFCKKQIKGLKRNLKDGLLQSFLKKGNMSFITAFSHTDLILGLIDYYQSTGKKEILSLTQEIIERCIKEFKIGKTIDSFYFPVSKFSLPIFDTVDGSFIELFVNFYELTKDDYYLNKSKELIDGFEKNVFFQKHYLIPERIINNYAWLFNPLFKSKIKNIKVMKNNTNTLYGFLEYYKVTKNNQVKRLIEKWFDFFCKYLISPSGGVFDSYDFSNNQQGKISLEANFATLDLFCDLHYFLGDDVYIKKAKKIADFWLKKQSNETKLFPIKEGKINSNLDAETDMIIALMKVFELTNNLIYKTAAEEAFEGIIRYHRKKKGYVLEVNIEDGKTTNDVYKIKFIILFLKSIILFLEGNKIYQDKKLFELLRDR